MYRCILSFYASTGRHFYIGEYITEEYLNRLTASEKRNFSLDTVAPSSSSTHSPEPDQTPWMPLNEVSESDFNDSPSTDTSSNDFGGGDFGGAGAGGSFD